DFRRVHRFGGAARTPARPAVLGQIKVVAGPQDGAENQSSYSFIARGRSALTITNSTRRFFARAASPLPVSRGDFSPDDIPFSRPASIPLPTRYFLTAVARRFPRAWL